MRHLLLLPAMLSLAACAAPPPAYIVHTIAGPAPAVPVFVLDRTDVAVYGLAVRPRGGRKPVWEIGTGGGNVSRPDSVTYGRAPEGFQTRRGPLPLSAGCYDVFASDGGVGRFTVRVDGTLAQRT